MTIEELKTPPTEIECAKVVVAVQGVPEVANIVRRLLFERDQNRSRGVSDIGRQIENGTVGDRSDGRPTGL